jgi:hypothetical protein
VPCGARWWRSNSETNLSSAAEKGRKSGFSRSGHRSHGMNMGVFDQRRPFTKVISGELSERQLNSEGKSSFSPSQTGFRRTPKNSVHLLSTCYKCSEIPPSSFTYAWASTIPPKLPMLSSKFAVTVHPGGSGGRSVGTPLTIGCNPAADMRRVAD